MTRRTTRRIFASLLIIASLVVAALPTSEAVADTAIASDFKLDGTTLVKYTGTASTVSVPASVKKISDEAFADNSSMTTLILPSGLKEISYAAFSGCNHLTKLTIPDSVEIIGNAAFCNCKELSVVHIGKGVKKLGTGVFIGCKKLSTVEMAAEANFVCADGVIYDKDMTTIYEVLQGRIKDTYDMPNSVVSIKPYSFYGCKKIKSVALSPYIDEIPAYAFSYCNGLTSITIPYSVNLIDMKAFENCVNLVDAELPKTVSFIHKTAFDGCSKLNIIAPANSYAAKWFETFDRSTVAVIEDEDEEPEKPSVSENEGPQEIEGLIGETVIVARKAVFFIDNTKFTVVSGKNVVDTDYSEMINQMDQILQNETNGKGLSLPKFAVLGNTISGKGYYGDTSLKEYTFPDNITEIGDFAFARTPLTSITIPHGVTSIGYGAFYHCDDLTEILIPSSVTDIGPSAFEKTRMLENWRLYGSSDFMIVGDGILVAYRGKTASVVIPEGVKQIGPEVFKGNTRIKAVSLPDSLIRICEDAFSGCSNLESISGGMNLEVIEDRAFSGCPLSTIRIVDTVKKIGLGAFNMSSSSLANSNKVAVFHGDNLPSVQYNATTTRLTNDSFRVDALEGVNVAIVNSENVNRVGTVLDRSVSGFSGLVCVIQEPNTEYFNGSLKIIDCTMTADEAMSSYIPSTIYIYGKGYNFIDDELLSVLHMAKNGSYTVDMDADFVPSENTSEVSFAGSSRKYLLSVDKMVFTDETLKAAYKRIYGEDVPRNIATYDISLREKNSEVWLTKFGKQTLTMSLLLPDNISTTNLHVICTDEYNQLEDLSYCVVAHDDALYVEFDINHTGTYGLYSYNSNALASALGIDVSPDTGDLIHPKWFLSFGLLLAGIALFLIKGKKEIAI